MSKLTIDNYAKYLPELGRVIENKASAITVRRQEIEKLLHKLVEMEREVSSLEADLLNDIEANWTNEEIREARCKAAGVEFTPLG